MRKLFNFGWLYFWLFIFFLCALFTGCSSVTVTDNSTEAVRLSEETLEKFDLSIVGEINNSGWRRGYLITIEGSDVVYIYDTKGGYTPFFKPDGTLVTVEDLK